MEKRIPNKRPLSERIRYGAEYLTTLGLIYGPAIIGVALSAGLYEHVLFPNMHVVFTDTQFYNHDYVNPPGANQIQVDSNHDITGLVKAMPAAVGVLATGMLAKFASR